MPGNLLLTALSRTASLLSCVRLLQASAMSQTKKLGDHGRGPEVTIDANGHCELPAGMTSVPNSAFAHWDGEDEGCKALKRLSIPSSVTEIGDGAFAGCSSLEHVSIPASVTEIGPYAFAFCSSLQHVTIPASVTKIGSYAFFKCSLKHVTISASVTQIGMSAFGYCSSLQHVTIPASVTEIGYWAFRGTALKSVIVPTATTFTDFYGDYAPLGLYDAFDDTTTITRLTPAVMEVRASLAAERARALHATPSSVLTHITSPSRALPPSQARRRLRLWSRTWFRLRIVVLFWQERAAISSCAEGGAGRKRDREDFEADNAM